MKFKVTRTSALINNGKPCDEAVVDGKYEYSVIINTLEELMAFIEKYGMIVLDEDKIEIYDDYRE